MNKKDTDRFKKVLLKQLEELEQKVEGPNEHLNAANDYFPDPTDRASAESDRNFDIRVRDRERRLIIKVKEALQRIEDGGFGICEDCGEPIDMKRLEARPVTTLCIECKMAREHEEKIRGE
ncbi:MAG TPA: RNA polymerase-binding protein DksA [bacterium]|nr:RNA polymerase-binding protein DksA [bacterium]